MNNLNACKQCDKPIPETNYHQKFCSKECRFTYHDEKKKTQRKKLICFECNNEFYSSRDSSRFCSDQCRWDYHDKKQVKDNAHIETQDELVKRIATEHNQDIDFIRRLHQSCKIAGFDFDRSIRRYCLNDKSIVIPRELQTAHKHVMDQEFRKTHKQSLGIKK